MLRFPWCSPMLIAKARSFVITCIFKNKPFCSPRWEQPWGALSASPAEVYTAPAAAWDLRCDALPMSCTPTLVFHGSHGDWQRGKALCVCVCTAGEIRSSKWISGSIAPVLFCAVPARRLQCFCHGEWVTPHSQPQNGVKEFGLKILVTRSWTQ